MRECKWLSDFDKEWEVDLFESEIGREVVSLCLEVDFDFLYQEKEPKPKKHPKPLNAQTSVLKSQSLDLKK